MKILMVCLGNICRSPLAEGILQHEADARGLGWQVDSAGTGGWHVGEMPDSRSVEVARRNGVDISKQRGRQLKAKDLDDFDLILAMDAQNYQDISRLATTAEQREKIKLMTSFAYPHKNKAVPDPYYGKMKNFEEVYNLLQISCEKLIEFYLQKTL